MDVDKERLQAIIDTSPDPIIITDLNGVIVDCNEAAPKTLGLSREDLINKSASLLLKQEESQIADVIQELLVKGQIRREFTLSRKNDEKIIADASMNIIMDANENPTNIAVVVRDITERKKYEEYIHLLSSVAEQAPEGIVVFDLEGRILFANSVWCEMRGISDKSSLVEERIENIYASSQVEGFFSTDQVFRGRLTMIRKDQSRIQVLAAVKLLEREGGKPIGAIHIVKKFSEIAREIQDIGNTHVHISKVEAK